jgi:hypothetical protein
LVQKNEIAPDEAALLRDQVSSSGFPMEQPELPACIKNMIEEDPDDYQASAEEDEVEEQQPPRLQ